MSTKLPWRLGLILLLLPLVTVSSQTNHGVSGLRVIRAILEGERRPEVLCELCDQQILKTKRAEVLKSLQGTWQDHHLFALRLALEGYEFCQAQAAACDRKIQQLLEKINQGQPPVEPPPGAKRARHNAPQIENLHRHLLTMEMIRLTAAPITHGKKFR